MATSARKHTVPAPLETPRRQAINDALASVNDIVPVANVTERAQLLADLGWTPSAARPLVISRGDAPSGAQFEYTVGETSGSTILWRTLAGESSANITAFGPGWSAASGAGHTPRVFRSGNIVLLQGAVVLGTGGSMTDILTVPAPFQPANANTTFIGSVAINSNGGTQGSRVLQIALGVVSATTGYGDGSPALGGIIPLGGCSWVA